MATPWVTGHHERKAAKSFLLQVFDVFYAIRKL